MKTERNILIAFLLNLAFSVFEFVGGAVTGSVAVASDAVHDLGDAAGVGISYLLEKKSKKEPDEAYTYGYARYSIVGSFITTVILFVGSLVMLYHAVSRMIAPTDIRYHGMIGLAAIGVCVNFCAALFTRDGDSLNQRAVNLHMLEDVFGWIVVLIGAVVMRFTNFTLIDPLLSVGVSVFILINAVKNLKEIGDLFLEKTPHNLDVAVVKERIKEIDGVKDVHHVHLWSIDGQYHCATLHIVTDKERYMVKKEVRNTLSEYGIEHVTIETEASFECCHERECCVAAHTKASHGCHHH